MVFLHQQLESWLRRLSQSHPTGGLGNAVDVCARRRETLRLRASWAFPVTWEPRMDTLQVVAPSLSSVSDQAEAWQLCWIHSCLRH